MYNAAVANTAYLKELSKSPYFVSRLNEAQLAYEREIAAAKATLKAEQQTIERAISKSLRKLSPEEVADLLDVPLDQVNRIAKKQRLTH